MFSFLLTPILQWIKCSRNTSHRQMFKIHRPKDVAASSNTNNMLQEHYITKLSGQKQHGSY